VIGSFFTVLLILAAALFNSPDSPRQWDGAPVGLVITTPHHPQVLSNVKVTVYGMPRGASHVKIVTEDSSYPAKHVGVRAFAAPVIATPAVPGLWQLNLQFDLHGQTYTTIGSVVTVDPR
jgi:hypothetical protein